MPRPSRVRHLARIGALAALAALPAHATGALVSVPQRCIADWPGQGSQPIGVRAVGLAPGQAVRLTLEVDGKAVSGIPAVTADAGGSISTQLSSWTSNLAPGPAHATPARMVVADLASGTELGAARFTVTNVGLDFDGTTGPNADGRIWEVSGLTLFGGDRSYWAHYFNAGKFIGSQRLGRPGGACGFLRTREALVPFDRFGTFMVKVQASRRYRSDRPWLGGTVTARRVSRD